MRKLLVLTAIATLTLAGAGTTASYADNGSVALGVAGGIAAGALLGSTLARPAPPPAVVYEEPTYYAPAPRCWREEQPLYDQWGRMVETRRVRVCR